MMETTVQTVDSGGSEEFEVLDVGCGNADSAKGDVNVDFFERGFNVQVGDQTVGEMVEPKKNQKLCCC
jgi:hypothetical protein